MSVHETRHERGERIEAHRHQHAYAALVLEGEYEEAGPDGVWRLEAGDLIVHPPFHMHLNRFEHSGARVLNLTLTHDVARTLGLRDYSVMRPQEPDRFTRNAGFDALGEALEFSTACAAAPPRDWLDKFAVGLRDAPDTSIGVLARENGVTPTHAARAFARRFGMTPATFRKELRLRAALQALSQGGASLAQIAACAGFADQAHMTRTFAMATGATPAKLRAAFH